MIGKSKKEKPQSRLLLLLILVTCVIWLIWLLSTRRASNQEHVRLSKKQHRETLSEKCVEQLKTNHVELTRWMTGLSPNESVSEFLTRSKFSDEFVLDMRQRNGFGGVASLQELGKMLEKSHGTAKGLELLVHEIHIEHQSPRKVIIVFEEHQEVDGKLQSLVYSRIHCRWRGAVDDNIEFYIQEESDHPYE